MDKLYTATAFARIKQGLILSAFDPADSASIWVFWTFLILLDVCSKRRIVHHILIAVKLGGLFGLDGCSHFLTRMDVDSVGWGIAAKRRVEEEGSVVGDSQRSRAIKRTCDAQ